MPTYPDCSHLHPDQGMTLDDMQAVASVAAQRDEIIMFRSTGAWSRPYIAKGHPTKPFHVKGKSSDWGPQAGLVPYDSEFSKAFEKKDIDKGRQANKDAIRDNYAKPVQLFLEWDFIQTELLVPKGINHVPPVDKLTTPRPGVVYFFCTKYRDDAQGQKKPYVLVGKHRPDLQGRYEIFAFPGAAGYANPALLADMEHLLRPVQVMAPIDSDLPITGDYDMFAVCPSWNSYGVLDKKMDPTLDDPRIEASRRRTEARAGRVAPFVPPAAPASFAPFTDALVRRTNARTLAAQRLPPTADMLRARASLAALDAAKTPEDPHRGNLTPRLAAVIRDLVAAMGGAYPRVHHNAESGRPFAPGAEDGFPLTIFHPRRNIGPYRFLNATIDNLGDLRDYFETLYANGYYPPRNRAWNMTSVNRFLRR